VGFAYAPQRTLDVRWDRDQFAKLLNTTFRVNHSVDAYASASGNSSCDPIPGIELAEP
jgi:hypothetical protein